MVVETVDYQQWETGNFPPPATPESVGARVLMQRRVESNPPARPKGKADEGKSSSVEFSTQYTPQIVYKETRVRIQTQENLAE